MQKKKKVIPATSGFIMTVLMHNIEECVGFIFLIEQKFNPKAL